MTNVTVVPVIDTSASMSSSGVSTQDLQIGVNAFLGAADAGDAIGVVSFEPQASVAYGPGGQVAVVDSSYTQVAQAEAAVNALTFTGSCANLGDGLKKAYGLLATPGAPAPLGAVLLTAGRKTCGPDPLHLSSYFPTYACAVGTNSDATLVQQIAALSKGKFYTIPSNPSLTAVLADIRSAQTGFATVASAYREIDTRSFWLQPATLASGTTWAQFVVVWENAAFRYTSSSNPGPGEVSITLVEPPGITLKTPPTTQGPGFVVFDLEQPVSGPGPWYLQIMYPGTAAPLPAAIAVFERAPSATGLGLTLEAPGTVRAGDPIDLEVRVTEHGRPVQGLRGTAEIVAPRAGSIALGSSGPRTYGRPLVYDRSGFHRLTLADTSAPGAYLVKVHVEGCSAISGSRFQRTALASLLVEPRGSKVRRKGGSGI